MSTNDPVLEVLRAMRGDLGLVTTELGRLVRHAEHANARLDSIDRRLERVDQRFETLEDRVDSLEQHSAATVTALGVLNAAVQAIVPALEQGRLRDDRLYTRVDECERRINALEQDR